MSVRYWQVHVLHDVDGKEATFAEVVGVVANSAEEAKLTCQEMLHNAQVLSVLERGHVRFIRHTMIGPNTKKFVNGVQAHADQAPG